MTSTRFPCGFVDSNLRDDSGGNSPADLGKQSISVQAGRPVSVQWHVLQSSRHVVPGVQVSVHKQSFLHNEMHFPSKFFT
jgi:hypothetical protein